jgi:hypothetical protein
VANQSGNENTEAIEQSQICQTSQGDRSGEAQGGQIREDQIVLAGAIYLLYLN